TAGTIDAAGCQSDVEQLWAELVTDGTVRRVPLSELVSLARRDARTLVTRFAVSVDKDVLLGDRFEFHELWQERERVYMLKLSIRGPARDRLRAIVFGDSEVFGLVEVDTTMARTEQHERV